MSSEDNKNNPFVIEGIDPNKTHTVTQQQIWDIAFEGYKRGKFDAYIESLTIKSETNGRI